MTTLFLFFIQSSTFAKPCKQNRAYAIVCVSSPEAVILRLLNCISNLEPRLSAPLQRIVLFAACPNFDVGEPFGERLGQSFDGEPLAGEVAWQQEADARRFGFETGVKPSFAKHHRVAAVVPGGVEKLVGRAASDRHGANLMVRPTDHLQPLDAEESFQAVGEFVERDGFFEPSPAARAFAVDVRRQRG